MANDIKNTRSILNNLIETCKDGQQGFQDAAQHVKDHNLKSLFFEFSQQRAHFAGELQQEVMRLGGEPEDSGTTAGAIHRGWIDVKAKITTQNDHTVLEEVERGEDAGVEAYQKALKENLPADIESTVNRQFTAIQNAHREVRALRNKTASSGVAF